MGNPRAPQKCKFCKSPAVKSLIWADGRAYIPVCQGHEGHARKIVRDQGDSVVDTYAVSQKPVAYREAMTPNERMEVALHPAPDFAYCDDPVGSHFGAFHSTERMESALAEAPAKPPPRAPIGRRDTPRGVVTPRRTGKDIQGTTGQGIAKKTQRPIKTKSGDRPTRAVTLRSRERQEIPDSLLQMLGTDWVNLRAKRVHDNRITLNIDGTRFSVYTRRG